jgi:hypothetical protein
MVARFGSISDQIEEGLVHSRIVGEFGMEGCGHDSSLPDGDWVTALDGNDFDVRANAFYLWSADEDHFER